MDDLTLHIAKVEQYTYHSVRRLLQQMRTPYLAAAPGFDISTWQASVNFETAKNNQVEFGYIRALYGLTVDNRFAQHWQNSKGKIKRGAYHYYKDDLDPVDQAVKFFNIVSSTGDLGEHPPTLDLETYGNPTLTASKIKKCLETLHNLFGKVPFVYSGYYVIRDSVTGDKAFLVQYPLWIAAYPLVGWQDDYPEKVLNYAPLIPAPWESADVWQWTSSAPAADYGVSGNTVDLDYCSPWFYETYVDPKPDLIEILIRLDSLATHRAVAGGVLYVGAASSDWNIGINPGYLVEVLTTPPRNGRVHVYFINRRAGPCFGWINTAILEPLEKPLMLRAVYP